MNHGANGVQNKVAHHVQIFTTKRESNVYEKTQSNRNETSVSCMFRGPLP
jgi:hypothetical protein